MVITVSVGVGTWFGFNYTSYDRVTVNEFRDGSTVTEIRSEYKLDVGVFSFQFAGMTRSIETAPQETQEELGKLLEFRRNNPEVTGNDGDDVPFE